MHQPVLFKEVLGSLNLEKGDCVLDATIGGGGHARVGAISFDVTQHDEAFRAAQEIVQELRASVQR